MKQFPCNGHASLQTASGLPSDPPLKVQLFVGEIRKLPLDHIQSYKAKLNRMDDRSHQGDTFLGGNAMGSLQEADLGALDVPCSGCFPTTRAPAGRAQELSVWAPAALPPQARPCPAGSEGPLNSERAAGLAQYVKGEKLEMYG